jgi:aryl-alcohol dehydrogenase-like predicted oxidoreductase
VDRVKLGRTGLEVSVVGLGCGGDSHLGLDTGGSEDQALDVIRRSLELGVTYFDTADEYGTEELVGKALAPVRNEVVISTKTKPLRPDGSVLDASGLRANVADSLAKLRTDHIDVYFLHMVRERHYSYCVDVLLPVLEELKMKGTIGHIAITEGSRSDPRHDMLQRAVVDDFWEVMMLAFNPFNASARRLLFPQAIAKNVGINVMCAARGPFSHADEMREVVAGLIASGEIDGASIDRQNPLGFILKHGSSNSVIDAAYRFARHEPGCHVILTGTGNTAHLEQNIASINAGPLPDADIEELDRLFGHLQRLTKG